ncbi:hypothetical protein MYSTI_06778 [Myxococcus stipitatus DSM 14675]|uniref:Thioredoxin domain-containing protein n=1 Tax=Myxococcus stipitatus (strain DSM 14675 / JCM 12634 / Mx s8) TaxID=1278073 RepID=L7UGF4_MYXSD|nr:hypothetical protein [Myxococcus stipitatus]AGC48051.1 hypothetical protein MYSTI_06778 [Myxococcus stipitatus DSM 14675]
MDRPPPRHRFAGAARLLWWGLGALSLSGVFVLGAAMVSVARLALSEVHWFPPSTEWVQSPLPFQGQLPRYALHDTEGAEVGTRQLRGHAYVLQFVAPESPLNSSDAVPRLTEVMHRLEARGVSLRFVVLKRRTAKDEVRAPPPSWHVVESDGALESQVWPLLREAAPTNDLHSGATLLVDQAGGLRGVYALAADARAIDALVADAWQLAEAGPVPAVAGLPSNHPHVTGVGCELEPRRP